MASDEVRKVAKEEGTKSENTSPVAESRKKAVGSKRERRELRVAFDTNVLFSGSASDLVRQEATSLINQSKFPDLDIQWYLPEVVRLERQFQMQKGALELLQPLARVERLLGHHLNITEEILIDRVEKTIAQRQRELGLKDLKPEYTSLDWNRLVYDATFRRAPFQDGKTEKGFRDALVVESFIHLVSVSPKTPKVCRVALVTGDALVTEAVQRRIAGSANTSILASLEELRGFINTLVSQVDEAFVLSLRPKAQKLFFVVKDESTLFYKEGIRERLSDKFSKELAAVPAGATGRKNGTWRISSPNFSQKIGQRIHWTSRVEVETEATKIVRDEPRMILSEPPAFQSGLARGAEITFPAVSSPKYSFGLAGTPVVTSGAYDAAIPAYLSPGNSSFWPQLDLGRSVSTHKGIDVYDVLWSVDVTTGLDLRRPSIDDILHVDIIWEAVS